jgi:hypothetical protein
MKVFISWSGLMSKKMAEAIYKWLPDVIQACEPWMSSTNIDVGNRWSSDLARELEETRFGILCLTPENLKEPWILFEAGALSKTIDKTNVCPYLLNMDPINLVGPLVQFQATKADEEGTRKLIHSINNSQRKDALTEERLNKAFDLNWPDLNHSLTNIVTSSDLDMKAKRLPEDMLEEVLGIVRSQSKLLSEQKTQMNEIIYKYTRVLSYLREEHLLTQEECRKQEDMNYLRDDLWDIKTFISRLQRDDPERFKRFKEELERNH